MMAQHDSSPKISMTRCFDVPGKITKIAKPYVLLTTWVARVVCTKQNRKNSAADVPIVIVNAIHLTFGVSALNFLFFTFFF